MSNRPTIFLSGVTHEFGAFRDDVENEIEMKGCYAENQPGFPPDYRTVEEMLRRKLDGSDAVICIIGFRFGAEPNQRPAGVPRRSYTQMEFDIAREMQKPVYVFLSSSEQVRDKPRTALTPEEAEAVQLQLDHRAAVQQTNNLYYFFRDKAELRRLVAEIPPVASAGFHADISRIDKYAPTELIGRESETQLLNDVWQKVRRAETPRPHVLTFVALGGEGKTSLVAKWAADLAYQNWPGCDAAFAWSFYSQGTRDQTAVSSDLFLGAALTFFGDKATAESPLGAHEKGQKLTQLVGERRALLILDGLEPLQYAPTSPTPGELKDQGITALLKGLAANNHGLCVVTTRYVLPDLRAFIGKSVHEEKLTRLSMAAGMALLQSFGVQGSLRKTIPSPDGHTLWNEFEKLVEDVKGHALTLNLLGSYLRDSHAGDIRRRDLIKLEEANAEEQGGHAFHVMDAYVISFENGGKTDEDNAKGRRALALLRLLGLFDSPATADCLEALWKGEAIAGLTEPLVGITEAQRNLSLQRLEDAKLLTVNRDASHRLVSLDAHPLLREYFGQHLREQQGEAWRTAHLRLYEHLCATTKEGDQPTLEDLQPLYQAVAHGCQAGLHQEALYKIYDGRIQRRDEKHSTRKLGAFGSDLGAVACFFETPWSRVSPSLTEADQAWVLNDAAFRLRALGRLTEALEPMRAGLEICIKQDVWKNAAVIASNLSELELTLGEVTGAVADAEQSVIYADRSGDAFQRESKRTTHADALHQAGRRAEAEVRFREAEQMQAQRLPAYPLLTGLSGFQYCDLLLTEAERAAWQTLLACGGRRPTDPSGSLASYPEESVGLRPPLALNPVESCRVVSERAAQTLEWMTTRNWLLDIAVDHLTLGRAALYAAVLQQSEFSNFKLEIEQAVSGIRRSGQLGELPKAFLTRAWRRILSGDATGSQADLDESWEIAERGPMPLYMADIHLYRARLFGRRGGDGGLLVPKYPWTSPEVDLAEARRLIEKHEYGRRKEELEDAEAALL